MEEQVKFESLGISSKVLKALEDMGFEEPSPIQARAIPLCLGGHDVIGQAQTGTGKTAAFGISIVEKIDPRARDIQAVVLTPTRELAIQVAEEVTKIGKHRAVKTIPIYGGQAIERQIRLLRFGVDVVIGTPGRIMDHMRRGTIRFDGVKVLVLDEADEMLDMGFIEDIEFILKQTPVERQTLLFSATMPEAILRLAKNYMKKPELISINREKLTVPLIEQYFYEVRGNQKIDALCRVVDMEEISRAIIFCRTKKSVDELAEAMQARGYLAEGIHGDLNQAQRNRVMGKFREGSIELLIATDVAARGLDIENVTHVINFDIPQDPESYVHRIGRTGRAGKTGTALTFIQPREFQQLRLIERLIKTRIRRRDLPSLSDIADKQREVLKEKLLKVAAEANLNDYRAMVAELSTDIDPVELAAAALRLVAEDRGFASDGDSVPAGRGRDGGRASGADVPYRPGAAYDRDKGRSRDDSGPEDFGETGAEPGMVRLFINIGRTEDVTPADIVRSIAGQSGTPGNLIGVIDIYDRFTFVEVPRDVAGRVMDAMQRSTIKGRPINIEPARRR